MENINAVSLSTCVFNKIKHNEIERSMEIIAEAGYRYVEVARSFYAGLVDEVSAVKKAGLKVWAVHGILGEGAISPDKNVRRNTVEKAFNQAAACAEFVPCPLVEHYLCRDFDPETGKYFRDSITMFLEKVAPLGYTLCIETAPYKPEFDPRYPDSVEIAGFVRSFNHENLQMIVDFNHSNLNEDLFEVAQNSAGLVKNIHVSQNLGERENHLPPDHSCGVIDLKAAFDAFRKAGYTGPCNLEFCLPESPTVDRLREIRLYMEKLLRISTEF